MVNQRHIVTNVAIWGFFDGLVFLMAIKKENYTHAETYLPLYPYLWFRKIFIPGFNLYTLQIATYVFLFLSIVGGSYAFLHCL